MQIPSQNELIQYITDWRKRNNYSATKWSLEFRGYANALSRIERGMKISLDEAGRLVREMQNAESK